MKQADPGRPPLAAALATPAAKHRYVRRLFHTIADRYDLITVLLSFGRDRSWKRRLAALEPVPAGTRVLDLACGTGDIAFEVARRGARVVGLDITERMVRLAQRKGKKGDSKKGDSHTYPVRSRDKCDCPPFFSPSCCPPFFLVGDMMALPFPDASFDIVTTGYGIRNLPELAPAIREIARVLRPGGTLLSLDFNRPGNVLVRTAYLGYLEVAGGALGWILHRDPDTYRYIPATIRRYPGAPRVAALMRDNGFASAEWLPVLGGLMAIHRARKG